MAFLRFLHGFALLLGGGEALVRGSVAVARRLGLSPLLIGLTLVGFGTSMPELVASIEAARQGSPAIAIANVVGSNIANTLLILGVAAVLAPLTFSSDGFRRDVVILALVTALLAGFGLTVRRLGRFGGTLFLVLYGLYILTILRHPSATVP